MVRYRYFVSFVYCKGLQMNFSNCEVEVNHLIESGGDIKEISAQIAKGNKYSRLPTILHYSLLKGADEFSDEYNPSTVDECLRLICDIAVDYDGYNTTENLKGLIDEMAHYANQARILLRQED